MLSIKIPKIASDFLEIKNGQLKITGQAKLQSPKWDQLVYQSVFGSENQKPILRWLIWEIAQKVNIRPASINSLYLARGQGKTPLDFTVPAINIRGMAYDTARAVFKTTQHLQVGAFICELARSEMNYTDQSPEEYTSVVLAAAIREGFSGPVFIQGDHFQSKQKSPGVPKEGEIAAIKKLCHQSIAAGFYNIDIDTSTLVNLDLSTPKEQQEPNIKYSLEIANYIRSIEPPGITVSLGGEIGHIGGRNSTTSDFRAFMEGFNAGLKKNQVGISKISVATGTHHGGVVLPDGTLADINVDFNVLAEISKIGRQEYHIGGSVQHGASTLPDKFFSQFTKAQALEVHLATGFQNIIMDHPQFPAKLLQEMYSWLDQKKSDERKENQTDEQFHYQLRKKALGQFKKDCWQISPSTRRQIGTTLEKRFEFMFRKLNVINTVNLVNKFITPLEIHKTPQDFGSQTSIGDTKGLSD